MQFSKDVVYLNMCSDLLIKIVFLKMVLKAAVFWKFCKTCRNISMTEKFYLTIHNIQARVQSSICTTYSNGRANSKIGYSASTMTLLYFHFAFFFVSFLSKFHVNPSGGFGFVSSCVITKLATKTLKKNNLVRGYNYYQSVFAKSQKKKKKSRM